jgi:hypothetical protein
MYLNLLIILWLLFVTTQKNPRDEIRYFIAAAAAALAFTKISCSCRACIFSGLTTSHSHKENDEMIKTSRTLTKSDVIHQL